MLPGGRWSRCARRTAEALSRCCRALRRTSTWHASRATASSRSDRCYCSAATPCGATPSAVTSTYAAHRRATRASTCARTATTLRSARCATSPPRRASTSSGGRPSSTSSARCAAPRPRRLTGICCSTPRAQVRATRGRAPRPTNRRTGRSGWRRRAARARRGAGRRARPRGGRSGERVPFGAAQPRVERDGRPAARTVRAGRAGAALLARRWRPPRGRPPAVPARGVRRGVAARRRLGRFPPRDGARWWRGGRGRGVGGAEDRRGVRAVRAAAAGARHGGDLEFGQLAGGWPSWEESGSRWPGLDGDLGIGTAPDDEEDPGPLAREDEDEEDFEGLDEGEAMHPVRRLLMGDDAATEEAILAAAVENATSAAEPTAQRHICTFASRRTSSRRKARGVRRRRAMSVRPPRR